MHVKVLGSAAGGGLPQWNCAGRNSAAARAVEAFIQPRTQSSLAVSSDGKQWLLLNASPDIRQQINACTQLHPTPQDGPRNSPIRAVILTNGDVDHVAGLLTLREGHAFHLYAAERVLSVLSANPIFNVLRPDLVPRKAVTLDRRWDVEGPSGPMGLSAEMFAVPGKVALYLEDETAADYGSTVGDTVGLKVTHAETGASFYYVPGCARLDESLRQRLLGAQLVFFDGTLFTNTEMLDQGLLPKTGERMGHMNMSGPEGSLAAFKNLNVARQIYIHINNSNPVLREDSAERAVVEAAGWEVAYDGMEISL